MLVPIRRDPRIALFVSVASLLILVSVFSKGYTPTDLPSLWKQNDSLHKSQEKLAYATWLSSTLAQDEKQDMSDDVYFIATRVLVWQLLHYEKTKTKDIDVVVLVTPDVDEARRERLRKDGAIVRPIGFLHGENEEWFHQKVHRWSEVMSKLRVWEMVEYSRILLLDGDMILQKPLDGIFDDPAAQITQTFTNITNPPDEPGIPETYLMASLSETRDKNHAYPPTDKDLKFPDKFNAGLMMLAPNKQLFDYYAALLDIPHRFPLGLPEQDLLNYAHRLETGPMPWQRLSPTWNLRYANDNDVDKGVTSMHDKWWKPAASKRITAFYMSMRWQMEAFYTQRDREQSRPKPTASKEARSLGVS